MRLTPSAEQTAFAAALHDLLAATPPAPFRPLWARLAEIGVTGLAVPAQRGGLGASPADLVVAAEELGHHAVPGPLAESLAAVPTLLAALDLAAPGLATPGLATPDLATPGLAVRNLAAPDAAGRWLGDLAAGRIVATLAAPPWLPFAADADAADLVLMADGGTAGRARPGVRAHPSFDRTRRLFEVSAAGALTACPAAGRALDLGALVCAAQLLGAGRALLEATVTHARTRQQFGGPIGRFQAVAFKCADMALAVENARNLTYKAAWLRDHGKPHRQAAAMAKLYSSEVAVTATREAVQIHGGYGFMEDSPVSRLYRDAKILEIGEGTSEVQRLVIGRGLGLPLE